MSFVQLTSFIGFYRLLLTLLSTFQFEKLFFYCKQSLLLRSSLFSRLFQTFVDKFRCAFLACWESDKKICNCKSHEFFDRMQLIFSSMKSKYSPIKIRNLIFRKIFLSNFHKNVNSSRKRLSIMCSTHELFRKTWVSFPTESIRIFCIC